MHILFITSNRIGDAVLSTGLLAHLMEKHPKARFTVVCGPAAAGLFAAMPRLERLIVLKKKKYAGHWFDLWRQTVTTRWDLVVDLRRTLISYVLPTKKRAIQPKAKETEHRIAAIGHTLGLTPAPLPVLWHGDAHTKKAEELLHGEGPFIGLGATANWAGKRWRPERFAQVVQHLAQQSTDFKDASYVIFGGPGEEGLVDDLRAHLPQNKVIDLVGKVDLLTARACIEKCVLYIGNDTGITHVAGTTKTPAVALFGPSPVENYGPVGTHAVAVCTDVPYKNLINAPDFEHKTTGTLMDSLSVEKVVKATLDLWNKERVSYD